MDNKQQPSQKPSSLPGEITQIIQNFNKGNDQALKKIMPIIYQELRDAAGWHLRSESNDHTLQPTALINEVYVRLAENKKMKFNNRTQFFSFAGLLMRQILVDYGRARMTKKRGGGKAALRLDESQMVGRKGITLPTLIALDQALTKLTEQDERQSRIIELRFFCGLSLAEMAAELDLSQTTIKREWRIAKHWLARELGPVPDSGQN